MVAFTCVWINISISQWNDTVCPTTATRIVEGYKYVILVFTAQSSIMHVMVMLYAYHYIRY